MVPLSVYISFKSLKPWTWFYSIWLDFSEIILIVWNFKSNSSLATRGFFFYSSGFICNAKKECVRITKTSIPSEFPNLNWPSKRVLLYFFCANYSSKDLWKKQSPEISLFISIIEYIFLNIYYLKKSFNFKTNSILFFDFCYRLCDAYKLTLISEQ